MFCLVRRLAWTTPVLLVSVLPFGRIYNPVRGASARCPYSWSPRGASLSCSFPHSRRAPSPRSNWDARRSSELGLPSAAEHYKSSRPYRPATRRPSESKRTYLMRLTRTAARTSSLSLEHPPEDVAVAKTFVASPRERERRVIGQLVLDAQAAKPAVDQIDLHLAAQCSFRANAKD